MLRWAAEHEATNDLEDLLGMAADMRGITVAADDSALEVLLTRDSGGSLRGCLEAARYNATHVAPVEVIRIVGTAIETLNRHDPAGSTPTRSPRKRSTAASSSNSSSPTGQGRRRRPRKAVHRFGLSERLQRRGFHGRRIHRPCTLTLPMLSCKGNVRQ